MQPIFFKKDFKWFIRTKWKILVTILLILSVLGVTAWFIFTPKIQIDKDNLVFVFENSQISQLKCGVL